MDLKRTAAALSAAALVAFPAGAMAKKGEDGGSDKGDRAAETAKKPKKPKKPKLDTYEFKGLVAGVVDGKLQVAVQHGNSKGRKFKGQTLTFDLSKAKLKVADANNDGKRDIADVAVGDRVMVQAKLPRGAVDASQALPARHVVDKGPVPAPEPADEPKTEEPKTEAEPKAPEAPPAS